MTTSYREHPVHRPAAPVDCWWEHDPVSEHRQLIVPDGHLDLIWLCDRELVVAGADTGPRFVSLPGGRRSIGIRLRVGAGGRFLGRPATEVRDQQVPAVEVLGAAAKQLVDDLSTATPATRPGLLASFVADRSVSTDRLIEQAASRLGVPGARVATVAADLGVSERQLNRRTQAALGYGPKLLGRVARLRRLARLPDQPLAERAFTAGYASQSHLSDEVRSLTGLTAVRFLEDRRPTEF